MTPPVSTSCSDSFCEGCGCAVSGGVVGRVVDPAGPDHADPGAGEDAYGVGMVFACGAGVIIDFRGPGAGVPAVVGEGGHRLAEPLVAGPAEVHGAVLAGLLRHGGAAGERGDGVGPAIGLAAVAPLGEHLGGVDLTRPWQRREDLAVRMLPEAGGGGAVEVLDCGVMGPEHG